MDSQTFYSRLARLLQKSRKALRLYSSVGQLEEERTSEFSDAQVEQWKSVNADLLRQLTAVLERPKSRTIVSDVVAIRDYFYSGWRSAEAELHNKQKELIRTAEHGDFVRTAVLSHELVAIKARMQACQAAHHEFNEVIKRSRTGGTIELSSAQVVEEEDAFIEQIRPAANVIPLRRTGRS